MGQIVEAGINLNQIDEFKELKGMGLGEVRERIRIAAAKNKDTELRVADLHWKFGHLLTREGNFPMTKHAALQLSQRAGVPQSVFEFLHKNSEYRQEWDSVIGRAWRKYQQQEGDRLLLVRRAVTNGPSGEPAERVRALLSDRYAVVDNVDAIEAYLQSLSQIAADKELRVFFPRQDFAHDHEGMRLRVLVPGLLHNPDDPHLLGLTLTNSEIGQGSVRIALDWLRVKCLNGLIDVDGGVECRVRHLGEVSGPERVLPYFNQSLNDMINEGPQRFRRYADLRDVRLFDPTLTLRELESTIDLGKRNAEKIIAEKLPAYCQELGSTAYALTNAITEFARDTQDREERVKLQTSAGKLVALPQRRWAPYLVRETPQTN